MIIAIDGLSVNGKSTLAAMISKKLGFKNFNTGVIYRCISLEIINKNLNINDIQDTIKALNNLEIDFQDDKVFLNGDDVSRTIREEKISYFSTKWATIIEIKEFVRKIQTDFINKYNVVMEGRDIGTRIAPNADIKFYLYSNFDVRVERLAKVSEKTDIELIRKNIAQRDLLDIDGGNFVKPINAIEIDSTNKTIDEVYEIMLEHIFK